MSLATSLGFKVSEVSHEKQRYDTIGDWIPGRPVEIRISRMRDGRFGELTALHETLEYLIYCRLCRGTDEKARAFDENYRGGHEEPGDDRAAPYHAAHVIATFAEKALAKAKRVDWKEYGEEERNLSASWRGLRRQRG